MSTPRSAGAGSDNITLAISVAIMLMALTALAGWLAHIPAAIRILNGLIPMPYNTALCFLALGAAGIGLSTRRRRLVGGGGSFATLIGGAVILEYATDITFGIDRLLFYPWDGALSADPGRMALTTAIGIFLIGASLVILAVRPTAYAIFGIVNAVPPSLALTSLIGYAFRITYVLPFGLGSQMALHTSAAILAYGLGMLAYAWKHAGRGHDGMPNWSAGIGVAFLPVLFVGATALFPTQSWQVVTLEVLFALVGVALITVAITRLTTAKVAYKGLLMIAVPLVLLLTFVGLIAHVKHQSESAQEWALHSTEVVGVSQSLLAYMAEAESAVRGYAFTGDEALVDSYEESLELITLTTKHLRTLVGDNRPQEARAARIEQLTAERTSRLSEIIRSIRSGPAKRPDVDSRLAKENFLARERIRSREAGPFSHRGVPARGRTPRWGAATIPECVMAAAELAAGRGNGRRDPAGECAHPLVQSGHQQAPAAAPGQRDQPGGG